MTNLTLGNGVTNIGYAAFRDCIGLTNVAIPDTVITLGWYAFQRCYFLKNVTLGNSVADIGEGAFGACYLTAITIPDSVLSIGNQTFSLCSYLTNITIGNGVTSMGDQVFYACLSLTEVHFRGDAPSPGSDAFLNANNATVYYYEGTSGWGATFGGRPTVAVSPYIYTINNGEVTIWAYQLPTVNLVITNSIEGLPVVNIANSAFSLDRNPTLASVVIPDSVRNIGDNAFKMCSALTSVTIGSGVTNLGYRAFSYTGLINVTIPDSVQTIGADAFEICPQLTTVTIGSGVTSIGAEAFQFCDQLTSLYFKGDAPSIGANILGGSGSKTVYYLPWKSGWSTTFAGKPTALWFLPKPMIVTEDSDFGVQSNAFGFNIYWLTNASVVVNASTTLVNPIWTPVGTNLLNDTTGLSHFSDPDWTNYPTRFYRLTTP